ncbi:MAG: hypothetical protein ABI947_24795 [Chloroflexota bacterium]
MSINVAWDNDEKTVIIYTFVGQWEWIDYWTAIKDAAELLNTVTYKVDIIMDMRNARTMPEGSLSKAKQVLGYPRHPNIGMTAIVGANLFIETVVSTSAKVYKALWGNYDMLSAASIEDARKQLFVRREAQQPPQKPAEQS